MVALKSKFYVINFLYDPRITFYNKMKIEYSIFNIEQLEGLLIKDHPEYRQKGHASTILEFILIMVSMGFFQIANFLLQSTETN